MHESPASDQATLRDTYIHIQLYDINMTKNIIQGRQIYKHLYIHILLFLHSYISPASDQANLNIIGLQLEVFIIAITSCSHSFSNFIL